MTLDLRPLLPYQRAEAIDAAVARYVLKAEVASGPEMDHEPMMRLSHSEWGKQVVGEWVAIPRYSQSADVIMPLLARQHAKIELLPKWARVTVEEYPEARYPKIFSATGSTVSMTGCIALLRSHGVEVFA